MAKQVIWSASAKKYWIIGLIIPFLLLYIANKKSAPNIEKKSTMAGYASGSVVDYRLILFVDSTYLLTTFELNRSSSQIYKWSQINDTILLKVNNKVCAKILGKTVIQYNQPEFNCLMLMEFIYFRSPEIVKFPQDI